MKFFRIGLLWSLILVALSSCLKENYDDCFDSSSGVILNYKLVERGKSNKDIFRNYINDVTMMIYDEDGKYVKSTRINESALNSFQGAKLNLSPGDYQIICFGNVKDNTLLEGYGKNTRIQDGLIRYKTVEDNKTYDGEEVFAAPRSAPGSGSSGSFQPGLFNLTVLPDSIIEDTINFTPFHRHVEVYVQGYDEDGELYPRIELTDITYGYDFKFQTLRDEHQIERRISLEKTCTGSYSPTGPIAVSTFCTSYFDNDCSIDVMVKNPSSGNIKTTVNMKKFLADNNVVLDDYLTDQNETTIRILVTILNDTGEIKITLPTWETKPVDPEY